MTALEHAAVLRRMRNADAFLSPDDPEWVAIVRAIELLEWMTDAERTAIENRIIND